MMGLTVTQKKLLDFLKARMSQTGGVAPTIAEMREHLNLRSTGNVHRMVLELEERGHIRRHPGAHRAIEIVATPDPIDAAREALTRVGAVPTMDNIARVATALSEARKSA